MLNAELKITTQWAIGMASLSSLYSMGRNTISYVSPYWSHSHLIENMLPACQPIFKSMLWGAFSGAYASILFRFSPNPRRERIFQIYTLSGFLSSLTTSFVYQDGSSPLANMAYNGRPFATIFLTYAAWKIAHMHFRSSSH
jgi:hypothetical protein